MSANPITFTKENNVLKEDNLQDVLGHLLSRSRDE